MEPSPVVLVWLDTSWLLQPHAQLVALDVPLVPQLLLVLLAPLSDTTSTTLLVLPAVLLDVSPALPMYIHTNNLQGCTACANGYFL